MTGFRQKLLALLNDCAEDYDEGAKLRYLAAILKSNDYIALGEIVAFHREYIEKYSVAVLEKLSASELKNKQREIQNTAKMFRLLQKAIQSGNAPCLTKNDRPEFDNNASIMALIKKLEVGKTKRNFTNLDNSTLMCVFDDSTLKSAQACFDLLPLSVAMKATIVEEDIKAVLGETLFCVDDAQLKKIHRQFLEFSSEAEKTIQNEKVRRKKYWLFKVAVVMLLALLAYTCGQFSVFTPQYSDIFTTIVFILSVVYLILG